MIRRLPFSTESVTKINDLLQEGIREIEANFMDEAYPREASREIRLIVRFEPDKRAPDDLSALLFKEVKLPKRYGKKVLASLRDGRLFAEEAPEQTSVFQSDGKVVQLKEGD
jgi:hypothetical protein